MSITIINSTEEPMIDATNILVGDLQKQGAEANSVYVEELLFLNHVSIGKKVNKFVYFLTNHCSTSVLSYLLEKSGSKVINCKFINHNYTKYIVQTMLSSSGLNVPCNFFSPKIEFLSGAQGIMKFPLVLKSVRHMDEYFVLNNYTEYFNLVNKTKFNSLYYLEEYLDDRFHFKAYVIDKKVYFGKEVEKSLTNKLVKDLRAVGLILSLDVYSLDYALNEKGDYKIFDVNPAPAFMGLKKAQTKFVDYLKTHLDN